MLNSSSAVGKLQQPDTTSPQIGCFKGHASAPEAIINTACLLAQDENPQRWKSNWKEHGT